MKMRTETLAEGVTLHLGDCRDIMPTLGKIDAVVTDPPYFRISGELWDRQWRTPEGFLAWMEGLIQGWKSVLPIGGSLSLFASAKMTSQIEVVVDRHFDVLNNIVWNKLSDYEPGDPRATSYRARDRKSFRRFFEYSERIIFAEMAGASRYSPLGDALRSAREKTGRKSTDIDVLLGFVRSRDPTKGTELFRRWEEGSSRPSKEQFRRAMRACGDNRSDGDIDQHFDDCSAESDRLRRYFNAEVGQHTDVWSFETVPSHQIKHPCEKPLDLMDHLIRCTTRPEGTVLDCFMGTGATGVSAVTNGRAFVGIELDERYFDIACRRITAAVHSCGARALPRDNLSGGTA